MTVSCLHTTVFFCWKKALEKYWIILLLNEQIIALSGGDWMKSARFFYYYFPTACTLQCCTASDYVQLKRIHLITYPEHWYHNLQKQIKWLRTHCKPHCASYMQSVDCLCIRLTLKAIFHCIYFQSNKQHIMMRNDVVGIFDDLISSTQSPINSVIWL